MYRNQFKILQPYWDVLQFVFSCRCGCHSCNHHDGCLLNGSHLLEICEKYYRSTSCDSHRLQRCFVCVSNSIQSPREYNNKKNPIKWLSVWQMPSHLEGHIRRNLYWLSDILKNPINDATSDPKRLFRLTDFVSLLNGTIVIRCISKNDFERNHTWDVTCSIATRAHAVRR